MEYLEDDLAPGVRDAPRRLLELYEQCHALVYGRTPTSLENTSGTSLSYHIAGELPLELDHKQELLELRDEAERQSRLLQRLNHWLPQLSYLERMRRKAGGNGHGPRLHDAS